jgi:hypothetical protein
VGYIRHRALIAEMPGLPGSQPYEAAVKALEDFRAGLPGDDWRALVIGPVQAVVESGPWVVFLPDGSKEGWDDSELGDGFRARFREIFPSAITAEWDESEGPSIHDPEWKPWP